MSADDRSTPDSNVDLEGPALVADLFGEEPKGPRRSYFAPMADARRRFGKPKMQHLREILLYCMRERRFTREEYYLHGFHRVPNLDPEHVASHIGQDRYLRMMYEVSPPGTMFWRICPDKVLTDWYFARHGLPTPKAVAAFRGPKVDPAIQSLETPVDIQRFLQARGEQPLFGKPLAGTGGVGALNFREACGADGRARLIDGRRVPVDRLAAAISARFPEGYVFQERLRQHPDAEALSGATVSSLRIVLLLTETGPEVAHAFWKLAGHETMADNSWQPGAAHALIDLDTGRVLRAKEMSPDGPRPHDLHGPNQLKVEGLAPPFWTEAVDLVKRGAELVEDFGLTAWDVALTVDGPLIIEVNPGPPCGVYQCVAGHGILTPRFLELHASARRRAQARIPRTGAAPGRRGGRRHALLRKAALLDVWNLAR